MQWPAMLNFPNSDELEIIQDHSHWEVLAPALGANCELISSDGDVYRVNSHTGKITPTGEKISLDAAVELARKHMAAQAHCCVSKFYAPSVAKVIAALSLLEDE